MPIDHSIYFQQQTPDIIGSVQRGLSMRDMLDKKALEQEQLQKQKQVDEAIQAGIVKGPDGSMTFDKNKTLSQLAGVKGAGKDFLGTQAQFQEMDLNKVKADKEKQLFQIDQIARVAGSVKDQASYDSALEMLAKSGTDVSQMPKAYDPNLVKSYQMRALTAKEQLEQQLKEQQLKVDQQKASTERIKAKALEGYRSDQRSSKLAEAFKKDLDADAGRTGNFGQVSKKVLQAQNLETLVNAFPDGNLDSRQIEELSLGLANMLSGSSGAARSQVEALVPHTAMGNTQKLKEWLMNEPQGANQQEFVKRMVHTIQREKETSLDQLNRIREQRLPAHSALAKTDPESYKALLQSYGLNPEDYDEKGLRKNTAIRKAAQSNPHPQDEAAVSWAKANPNDPRSAQILKANGM